MAEPPEFWIFLLSNVAILLVGGAMTALSYGAFHRHREKSSFRNAAAGFGLITVGSLVEVIYELGIRGSYDLGGRELLVLHTVEGFLIALGLATLFYSIRNY